LLVGYLDLSHVGPAIAGAAVFALGIALFPRRALFPDPTAPGPVGQSSSPWAEAVGSPSRGRGSSPGP
jgi:hypothetical protein